VKNYLEPKKKTDVTFNGEKLGKSWMIPYRTNVDKEFENRYNKIKTDFDELMDEVYWNNLLYDKGRCEIRISPIVNGEYHLYQRENESFFISIIAPDEWRMEGYIGTFKFLHTGKWLKIK
jgi:hypothetical protein